MIDLRLALAILLLTVVAIPSCRGGTAARNTEFKVVVLGFDGVDPDLVREWLPHLPNIRKLSESGTLTELGTTNPPESPVAWSSFATGMNPGRHGIFDFLRRDPETYFPEIGLVEVNRPEFLWGLIPWRKAEFHTTREVITYSLHDALPIHHRLPALRDRRTGRRKRRTGRPIRTGHPRNPRRPRSSRPHRHQPQPQLHTRLR